MTPNPADGGWLDRSARGRYAFSRRIALAIYYMYYNFGRIHKTLRVTPAMEAGIS